MLLIYSQSYTKTLKTNILVISRFSGCQKMPYTEGSLFRCWIDFILRIELFELFE
jgi:hypothetical protein